MKEFTTAVRTTKGGMVGEAITVKVDDEEIHFSPATEAQVALLLASTAATGTTVGGVADTINFFFSLIHDNDEKRSLRRRLFDSEDDFDIGNIADIVAYLVEEWTARPTQPPSDSMPLQDSDGQRSTATLSATG